MWLTPKKTQVSTEKVVVQDSAGKVVESQLLPLSNATIRIRKHYVKAHIGKAPSSEPKYLLAFSVSVPPLGFSIYRVSRPKQTSYGYCLLLYLFPYPSSTRKLDWRTIMHLSYWQNFFDSLMQDKLQQSQRHLWLRMIA